MNVLLEDLESGLVSGNVILNEWENMEESIWEDRN